MNTDAPLYLHYKKRLSQSPIFSRLTDETLSHMLEKFQYTTWRKGVVPDPQMLTQYFYLIIDGRVKIERIDTASGNRAILFMLGPGDGFDVITLLDGQPHEAAPVALEDLNLLRASTGQVREWINHHPEFNRSFLPYLGERMRSMEDLAADLAMEDTVTRLARLILRHAVPEPSSRHGSHPVTLIHDLPHDSLAHMIGSTRQVVNRHLQALRREGVLDQGSKHLVVAELEALKERAGVFLSRHQQV